MENSITLQEGSKAISLPVDQKNLGEFISSLLGQPQELERDFYGTFSIDHQWIIHLVSMVLQRIQQQNLSEIIGMRTVLEYDNGYRRKIPSLSALHHFSETINAVCTTVSVGISALIKFPGKEIQEKQEIYIVFLRNEDGELSYRLSRQSGVGRINILINHTERTWADDIVSLVSNEIDKILVGDSGIRRLIRNGMPFYGFVFPAAFFISMIVGISRIESGSEKIRRSAEGLLRGNDYTVAALNAKLDYLISVDKATHGFGTTLSSYMLISIGVAAFLYLLARYASRPSPSFILLSKASEQHKNRVLEKQRRNGWILFGSMILSLLLGVAGNYVYDFIK